MNVLPVLQMGKLRLRAPELRCELDELWLQSLLASLLSFWGRVSQHEPRLYHLQVTKWHLGKLLRGGYLKWSLTPPPARPSLCPRQETTGFLR